MPARVLIVDDEGAIRQMLRALLTHLECEVVGEARDGAEAIRLYGELRPELVVLDVMMPGTDGITALRQMMADDPDARIVMCSALGKHEIMALRAGARGFITKPFLPEQVRKVIEKALA